MSIDVGNYKTAFLRKKQLSVDTYSFFFQRPVDFEYQAGQYIQLALQIDHPDERGSKRDFSFVSSPTQKDELAITTRIIQSSFKKVLVVLPEQTVVDLFGPFGKFILKEGDNQYVFLAGGIGITPLMSMIRYTFAKNLPTTITLFTSFKTASEIIYKDELQKITHDLPSMRLVETITRPELSKTPWSGHVGRIDADWIKSNIKDAAIPYYYISGPGAMVDGLKTVVQTLGVAEDKIVTEKFPGY